MNIYIYIYPPPRLPRRCLMRARTPSKNPLLERPSADTPWERFPRRDSLGVPPWERLPGRDSLGEAPWECLPGTLPGRASLGETPWERFPGRDSLERIS